MDTKLATSQIRIQQWAAIIKDCCGSGQTVDDYCEQHQLSRNSYYYWLRKVKAAALTEVNKSFVELEIPQEKTSKTFSTNLTLRVGQIIIEVNESTSMDLLSRTLGAIQHAQ